MVSARGVHAVEIVIGEIADEESRGDDGGGDHGVAVGAPAAGLDEEIAQAKKDAAEAVQGCVDGGKTLIGYFPPACSSEAGIANECSIRSGTKES